MAQPSRSPGFLEYSLLLLQWHADTPQQRIKSKRALAARQKADTLGIIWAVVVLRADVHDGTTASFLVEQLCACKMALVQ